MEKDYKEYEAKNEDLRDSEGALNEETPSPIETVSETFEDIDIGVIQHFTAIPDYKQPTDSKYPILVKTPLGHFCIDGWNLLEEAKANGNTILRCAVDELVDHSEEELPLRKASVRVRPRGGIASYAEVVRNTKYLEQILLTSDKDYRVLYHGGARKGTAFVNNRQDNVVAVLSERFGKSPKTINQYLNHGRFLNDEALRFLVDREARKDFFEAAQPNKMWKITSLTSQRFSNADITAQISNHMLMWYEQFLQSKKLKPWSDIPESLRAEQNNDHVEPSQETILKETQERVQRETVQDEFHPWEGNPVGDEDDSLKKIKEDVDELSRRLHDAVLIEDPNQFCQALIKEDSQFHLLSLRAAAFKNALRTTTDSGKEVSQWAD